MMIPYGYKQTEVGVIPEDWECVKIKDVATISMCKRIFANQTSTIGDVPFYKIGTFGKEADACISSKLYVEYRNKYSFPQKGDILISAAGTLGRTVVYDGEKAYFQDSNIVWLDINKTRLCNEYLNQYYKVIKWASSEGSTIARLYNGIIYATYISLPPLPEQQRIAEALSDVDELISSLEKLIEKYKSIKATCLQQMFPQKGETTPKMRLPGFTGAWEQRKAIDIADYSKGNGYSKGDLIDVGTPIILYGRLYTKYQFAISEVDTFTVPRNGAIYSQGNEVIVPASGETAEDIARASAVEKSGVLLGGDLNILRPFDFINPLFLALAISNGEPQKELAKKAQGKSVVHIHNTDIQEVTIAYPSKTEQDRIVSVFRQLDNLITLHQRKLDKAKKIKQGMMQQLLTGKIRLV